MDFFNFFKGFLGIPNRNNSSFYSEEDQSRGSGSPRDDYWRQPDFRNSEEPDDTHPHESNEEMFFNVFTNPLEMHRYFEQQMNDMLKSMSIFGNTEDNFFQMPSLEQMPALEEAPKRDGNLREQFLKPGFEHADSDHLKKDTVLDGEINLADLDKDVSRPSSSRLVPFSDRSKPQIRIFGQSMTSKVIRRPDGSQEIHKTVVDRDGNETKTITKQYGDKSYTVTTKTDKHGQKEITEDRINMGENEMLPFKPDNNDDFMNRDQKTNPNWFPFDKYFK